jgi:hypothetical protein
VAEAQPDIPSRGLQSRLSTRPEEIAVNGEVLQLDEVSHVVVMTHRTMLLRHYSLSLFPYAVVSPARPLSSSDSVLVDAGTGLPEVTQR